MPWNVATLTNQNDIITTLNNNNITSTDQWYVVPRLNLWLTHTNTYSNKKLQSIDDIVVLANNNNYSDLYLDEWFTGQCKQLITKNTTYNITETYVYDLYYFTP
jgi:hypothetical protein